MNRSQSRAKNGRDFAIAGVLLAFVLAITGDYYFAHKYSDTPSSLIPWYAANSWVNLVVLALVGGIVGWFIGISIPIDTTPQDGHPWGKDPALCPYCHRQNRKGDRFCERCGSPLL